VPRTLRAALATAAVLTALAVAATPVPASAGGFEKASWGMTPDQVKKLYPGGTKDTSPAGDPVYFVKQKFATQDAVVAFGFDGGRLAYVAIRFPEPGRKVDMKRVLYPSPTNDQAKTIAATVRKDLGSRYGTPYYDADRQGPRPKSPTLRAAWNTPDGDSTVTFEIIPDADGVRTDVGVSYGKRDN
jgi:hypothetical protein